MNTDTLFNRVLSHLHQQGERVTIQRRLVLQILCNETAHLSLYDLHERLKHGEHELNETTIYRILQWLKEFGIISQTDMGGNIVYQVVTEKRHHHLVCLKCNTTLEMDDNALMELRDYIRHTYHFEPRIDHMAIFGVCERCQNPPA